MRIDVVAGAIQRVSSEAIVVNLFRAVRSPGGATGAVDQALDGAIAGIIEAGDFQGKEGETAVLYTHGAIPAKRVIIVGLGEQSKFNLEVVRRASAAVARKAQSLRLSCYHSIVHGGGAGGSEVGEAAQAVAEGTLLGSYTFTEHKTDLSDVEPRLDAVTLVQFDVDAVPAVEKGSLAGQVVAESVCFARDLGNQPANYLTPMMLAETAEEMAGELGLSCQVLDEGQMSEIGMGALLGVAQGSDEPARFIVLEHASGRDDLDTYVVIGKGITFDSGGISLKPGRGMEAMKADMCGAGVTLGALRAAAALNLPLHVVGLVPATENLPGGRAYKPGDVLKSMSGLTIEVISTDAEGRLILADALGYAKRYEAKGVVDVATLTGACVVALGHVACGLMGNSANLIKAIKEAAAVSGERVWELPMYDEYAEQLKSDVGDVKNTGGRPAGAITAALFLSKFAKDYPWAHLDIAGMDLSDKVKGYLVKGATGFGLRLLVQWLRGACEGAC